MQDRYDLAEGEKRFRIGQLYLLEVLLYWGEN